MLRDRRIELGLGYENIIAELKIQQKFLEALENNEFDIFSSKGQMKGFTKNYAEMLGLNTETALALLKRDSAKDTSNRIVKTDLSLNRQSRSTHQIDKQKNILFNSKSIKILLSIFVIAIILLFVYWIVARTFQKPFLKITSPFEIEGDFKGKLEYSDRSISIDGYTEQGSIVTVNDLRISLNGAYEFKTPVLPLGGEENVISIKAQNAIGSTTEIQLRIVPKEVFISQINIVLQNTGNSSKASILVDKVEVFNDILVQGQVLNLNAISEFSISIENPQNLSLKINSINFPLKSGLNTFVNTGQQIVAR